MKPLGISNPEGGVISTVVNLTFISPLHLQLLEVRNVKPNFAFHCCFMRNDSWNSHVDGLYHVDRRLLIIYYCFYKISDKIILACPMAPLSHFLRSFRIGTCISIAPTISRSGIVYLLLTLPKEIRSFNFWSFDFKRLATKFLIFHPKKRSDNNRLNTQWQGVMFLSLESYMVS